MPISTTGTNKRRHGQNSRLVFRRLSRDPSEIRCRRFLQGRLKTLLFFTLPEVIAVMAILLILAAMAMPMLRSPSASSRMEETALEFQAFCGRVRFQAVEKGEDRAVCFDSSANEFFLSDPADPEAERSSIRWKLPEGFEYSPDTELNTEPESGDGMELFRYYPDGGASGTRVLVMRCGKVRREFRISLLTGLLSSRELSEEEVTP